MLNRFLNHKVLNNKTWAIFAAAVVFSGALTIESASPLAKPTDAAKKPSANSAKDSKGSKGSASKSAKESMTETLNISIGRGHLITLPRNMSNVFVADPAIADVQVSSPRQIYIYGKAPGETSIHITNAAGRVIHSVIASVDNNIETLDQMLKVAMPSAEIQANKMNGLILLTGTVETPEDISEAQALVEAFVDDDTQVISRLQTATPLQVSLHVKIAEVSRNYIKEISGSVNTADSTGGFLGGISYGRNNGTITPGSGDNPAQYLFTRPEGNRGSIFGAGRLLGLNVLASLDLGERAGYVRTLAEPNLTAISGETAEFLVGGEFPVPTPQAGQGGGGSVITIEYQRYGVSLSYTPTVLSNGRISLRVAPEVSELSDDGSVSLQGFSIRALNVRRAETTVELGSGQSFMIAGLLQSRSTGAIDKIPGLGDIPILGSLYKSDDYRSGETELVIVVTPYLVKPVSADEIRLPTDGFNKTDDFSRNLFGKISSGDADGERPKPGFDTGRDESALRRRNETAEPGFAL